MHVRRFGALLATEQGLPVSQVDQIEPKAWNESGSSQAAVETSSWKGVTLQANSRVSSYGSLVPTRHPCQSAGGRCSSMGPQLLSPVSPFHVCSLEDSSDNQLWYVQDVSSGSMMPDVPEASKDLGSEAKLAQAGEGMQSCAAHAMSSSVILLSCSSR